MGAGRTARGQGRRRPLWLVLALSAVAAAALALGGAAGGGGVAADGSVAAVPTNEESQDPAISADGRFVAFDSFASNLVAGDTNGVVDVFVRDRVAGATERVSVSSSGAQANGSVSAAMSADGRFVAFSSDLVAGDTLEDLDDVFVRDRVAGTTKRVSVSSTGAQANDSSKLANGVRYHLWSCTRARRAARSASSIRRHHNPSLTLSSGTSPGLGFGGGGSSVVLYTG